MIDIHCHILPAVDDGSRSIEESLKMAEIAVKDGIHQIVATPHSLDGVYTNRTEDIVAAVAALQVALAARHLDLKLHPGSDLHLATNMAQRIRNGEACSIDNAGKYMLLEFPSQMIPNGAKDEIFALKLNGITPIITHPERNAVVQHNPGLLYEFIQIGALAQVTAMSLTGDFGDYIAHVSHILMQHRLIHVIATDAHSAKDRRPILSGAVEQAADILKDYDEALRMVTSVPAAILSGQALDVAEPMRIRRTARDF